jgi:hypothetical protein
MPRSLASLVGLHTMSLSGVGLAIATPPLGAYMAVPAVWWVAERGEVPE